MISTIQLGFVFLPISYQNIKNYNLESCNFTRFCELAENVFLTERKQFAVAIFGPKNEMDKTNEAENTVMSSILCTLL